ESSGHLFPSAATLYLYAPDHAAAPLFRHDPPLKHLLATSPPATPDAIRTAARTRGARRGGPEGRGSEAPRRESDAGRHFAFLDDPTVLPDEGTSVWTLRCEASMDTTQVREVRFDRCVRAAATGDREAFAHLIDAT